MDWLDVIILAAAVIGVVAFIVLTVVIVLQGRSLRRLEDRVGPPVPVPAAPALERVRAVTSTPRRDAPRTNAPRAASTGTGAPRRGLAVGAVVVVLVGLLGAGTWFLFLRDDGGSPSAEATASTTPTRTVDTGAIPADVPQLTNKALYTVAVLNASGVNGAAANRVAPRVQAAGYTLGVVDNAAKQGVPDSVVQYRPGKKEVGWNLARDLGVTKAFPVDAVSDGLIGTADAVIIVGRDLSK